MDITCVKNTVKEGISLLNHWVYTAAWKSRGEKEPENCLNREDREDKIVVSLTSFPGRIHLVHETIRTILNQKNVKPDCVELWLAMSQFPQGEAELPHELLQLKKYGLHLCWCDDIRSYKKLIPALKKHPDALLVTADDDVYYREDWLEKLYAGYQKAPGYVYCHRATQFYLKKDSFDAVGGGRNYYKKPSYLNKLVGVGGVLYAPGVLHPDVTDEALFMELAPTNDDIWFWFMAILNDVRICVVGNHQPRPIAVVGAEQTEKLTSINDKGEKKFWQQFHMLLKKYPSIEKKLRLEAQSAQKGNV